MPRFYTINFLFYVPSFYTLNLLYYAQFLYNKLALWCPQFLQNIWFSLKHTKHNYQLCHQTLQSPCCYVQRVAIKCLTLHRNIRPTGSALKTGIAQCSDAMRGNTTYIAVFPEHGSFSAWQPVTAIVFRDTVCVCADKKWQQQLNVCATWDKACLSLSDCKTLPKYAGLYRPTTHIWTRADGVCIPRRNLSTAEQVASLRPKAFLSSGLLQCGN